MIKIMVTLMVKIMVEMMVKIMVEITDNRLLDIEFLKDSEQTDYGRQSPFGS